ncbi:HAD family hydrolase [Puniceicoccus vermicola]|uniref:HAD family phosphatase n=1 Tax=Puniceicoccus vermicola TaxID=388746 RepID=A0A7X1AV62_9BACT|nr:HAD family phosphatase [Puniceicoccus vermicola]MBC2600464.1 HAD family phosphatase [Puniceicoccus vermicola]
MSLTLPPGRFDAYIFDCDGTLIDSMPLHLEAWNYGLRQAGADWDIPEDYFYDSAGKSLLQVVEELNARFPGKLLAENVGEHKEEFYHRKIHDLKAFSDVVEHLKEARDRGIPTAVASGSARFAVEKSLEVTGLISMVDVIVAAEDVTRGKPAPDCFLLAAEQLGVDPLRCLVFEDGKAGLKAAGICGMATVEVDARRGAALHV